MRRRSPDLPVPTISLEVYTDKMSQELIGIIGAATVLAGIIVTGQWAMRRDLAALGECVGKVENTLGERMARLEVATEGFIEPQ